MTDRVSVSFEPIAEWYDVTRGGEAYGRRMAAAIRAEIDPSRLLLDVGIGTGLVAAGLAEEGVTRITGIDLSAGMLTHAVRRLGPCVARADALALPVADAAVDQVLSVWLLQHVADPGRVLAEVARVLRPGGRYVVVPASWLPSSDPIGGMLDELFATLDPHGLTDDRHERLAERSEGTGLVVEDVRELPAERYVQTPAQAAGAFETRVPCTLWALDEAAWRDVAKPLIDGLRARPDADVPMERTVRRELVVLVKR